MTMRKARTQPDHSERPTRAGIYVRISRDRTTEVSTAVQERDCRQYAKLKGWKVAEVYSDIGLTASKRNVVRPSYERLLADVEAGKIDVVVIWKLDRLGRSVIELSRVAEHLRDHGTDLASVNDSIDTSTPGGRFVYTVLSAVAQLESEQISLRVTAASDQRAREGRHHGGARVFGYEPDGNTIRPDEAELVREAARRIIAGETLLGVATDFNQRGVPTAKAGEAKWWAATVARVVLSDHACGIRQNNGTRTAATWPAIIDEDTRRELLRRISDPDRRATGTKTRSLLSGILHCGLCHHRLSISHHRIGRRYGCKTLSGGCGKIHVYADAIEAELRDRALVALADPAFRKKLGGADRTATIRTLTLEVDGIERRMDELAVSYAEEEIGVREWKVARGRLEERLASALAELEGAKATAETLPDLPDTVEGLEGWWAAADDESRRLVLRAVYGAIGRVKVVRPRKAGRFDPERIVIDPDGT